MDRVEIKVIFGSDVIEIIIFREVWEGFKGLLFGIKIKFGWIVIGIFLWYFCDLEFVCFIYVVLFEEELNELVKIWWKIELFGCKYDSDEWWLKEDELILEFLERIICKVDGRY